MAESYWDPDKFSAEVSSRLHAALAEGPTPAALTAMVRECAGAAEAVAAGRDMACGAGCPYCCVLNVGVLLPEALLIADWLKDALRPAQLSELQKKLARHRAWARWMDDDERIGKKVTCPFLDPAGSCSIHPVRPLACRGVTSLDSDRCRLALSPTAGEDAPVVVSDLLRKSACTESFRALSDVLKVHWLDHRSIELGSGVLAFLEDPTLPETFLSGGKLPDRLWQP